MVICIVKIAISLARIMQSDAISLQCRCSRKSNCVSEWFNRYEPMAELRFPEATPQQPPRDQHLDQDAEQGRFNIALILSHSSFNGHRNFNSFQMISVVEDKPKIMKRIKKLTNSLFLDYNKHRILIIVLSSLMVHPLEFSSRQSPFP